MKRRSKLMLSSKALCEAAKRKATCSYSIKKYIPTYSPAPKRRKKEELMETNIIQSFDEVILPEKEIITPTQKETKMKVTMSETFKQMYSKYLNFNIETSESSSSESGDFSTKTLLDDEEFYRFKQGKFWNFSKVNEVEQVRYNIPVRYSVGHFVTKDMDVWKGIGVTFENEARNMKLLLEHNQEIGSIVVLKVESSGNYNYYLVTKKHAVDRVEIEDLWNSLKKLRSHILEYQVENLALPILCHKTSGLDWFDVKSMIEFIFRKIDVNIVVYNSKNDDGLKSTGEEQERQYSKCERSNSSERDEIKADEDGEYFVFQQRDNWELCRAKEVKKDIFCMPSDYSLGYCVCEDMKAPSENKFNNRNDLLRQDQKVGGLAVFKDKPNKRYVYYLITKKHMDDRVELINLWSCLKKLRDHVAEHKIKNLAIPKLGCEDKVLAWQTVKSMMGFLFMHVITKITVCELKCLETKKTSAQTKKVLDSSKSENCLQDDELGEEFFVFKQQGVRWSCSKIQEVEKDLFNMPPNFSLGHCVAEDMAMGKGIALAFKTKFGNVAYLRSQNQKSGGLALLKGSNGRFIYYLVTKRNSRGKPRLEDLWKSLRKMRTHIVENHVTQLAIPTIGCGLDGLIWYEVRSMIDFIFRNVDIKIVVCKLKVPDPKHPGVASKNVSQ